MNLPPAFDAATYRARNPALAHLSDAEAHAHYEAEGRPQGLIASPLAIREGLLQRIAAAPSVLEIGPFCSPMLKGPHVEYLDVLDADALRERAPKHGLDPAGCPEVIHHVGDLAQVDRRYAAVASSHSIEHQPDLVRHLREVERVLEADGAYYLLIPDKRYCLDHFLPESSIAQVLQAHREGRRRHALASVIEHDALTTHNDPARHWAGDHGDPGMDRIARVAGAVARHDTAAGGYVDVHAWQFTPRSFRETIGALHALGLIGLEVAEVYDTAHGRNEFAAVLRPDGQAAARLRARQAGIEVIALQTADADRYARMLAITQPNLAEYCRRHGFAYEAFIGLKRGFHPWQATYNRIPMLSELAARGFQGWALYCDADAYVADMDFDLAGYLARHRDRGAIFATSGVTGEHWDVNAGVALINLGHPLGRRLVEAWSARFEAVSDERLRAGVQWFDQDNDQDLLHRILREDQALAGAVLVESMEVMNGPAARFVRQHLRTHSPTFEARLRAIAGEVAAAFRRADIAPPAAVIPPDDRWQWRLSHPARHEPALVEAPVPAPRPDLAGRAIAAWRQGEAKTEGAGSVRAPLSADFQSGFADALARGDVEAVAADLAGLGKAKLAQGFFGGARQHERARQPLFAHRLALWTYDKLVSLAEAIGALPLELAENGRWAANAATPPAELFALIEAHLGADLTPPAHVGGHLGIAVRDGIVLHMRMIDSIHAAFRLREMGEALGHGRALRVLEIGPGAGLTAFYAARLGLTGYGMIDLPTMNAVQAYVLGDLPGVRILPASAFASLEPGGWDLLFNADSLPEIERGAALGYLAGALRLGIRHFLSINQEAGLPGQESVPALIAQAGGWTRAARHRHWLRTGYAEEHWISA